MFPVSVSCYPELHAYFLSRSADTVINLGNRQRSSIKPFSSHPLVSCD